VPHLRPTGGAHRLGWHLKKDPEHGDNRSFVTALTYDEARERAGLIDVLGYCIDLDVTGGEEIFSSVTIVRFGCRAPGTSSFIELRPTRLHRVVLNGQEVDPGTLRDGRLPLAGLLADNELRVEADMPYSRTGEGMHRFTDEADGETYLALHGGLDNAQRVFAAFDQPDMKAVIRVAVTAPGRWIVMGNGVSRPGGAGATRRWELAATPPISVYLVTVLAGPYHSIRSSHRGVPLGLYSRQSLAGHLHRDAAEIFAITRACFDRYLEIFDEPYPFDSYDQAFVPELEAGAMENPGCVTFRDEFLFPAAVTRAERQTRGMVIAHEMSHMWFGNLVTMRWWNDVWLSESFATYMGFQVLAEATAFTGTWTDFALTHKPRGYDADQRPSVHPVAPEPHEVPDTDAARSSYDDISYAKGASALRQLVAWIGRPAFLAGINDYFGRYRFASATLADLLDCLDRASSTDVLDWAGHWLRTSGVDTLAVSRPAPGRQVAPDGPPAPDGGPPADAEGAAVSHAGTRPHRIWIGVYDEVPDADALVLRERIPVLVPAGASQVVLPRAAVDPAPALLLPNDDDVSYCKIRLDPPSQDVLASSLHRISDPLSRAVAWNSARNLVRDGELAPQAYLELALSQLAAETDQSIAGQVLAYARWTIADRYLSPGHRGAALASLHVLCRELTCRPARDDDGGMRLIAGRGLIDSASRPDDVAALRSWLAAGRLPGGPNLDSRLRWQILLRLAVLGALAPAEIGREAAADTTAAGRLSAARCRAARPAEAAKAAAWATMFGETAGAGETAGPGETGSGYQLAATAQGFWQADQAELLADYVPRYFPALARTAEHRGADAARVLIQHGFPQHAADTATLQAGRPCLADGGLIGSLRRLLADQLADLSRAVDVRAGIGS
jgi:aminopeptidase N